MSENWGTHRRARRRAQKRASRDSGRSRTTCAGRALACTSLLPARRAHVQVQVHFHLPLLLPLLPLPYNRPSDCPRTRQIPTRRLGRARQSRMTLTIHKPQPGMCIAMVTMMARATPRPASNKDIHVDTHQTCQNGKDGDGVDVTRNAPLVRKSLALGIRRRRTRR